jgi:hypothetical protein
MLLNLSNKQSFKSKDNYYGGILCSTHYGLNFGNKDLKLDKPFNKEGNLRSKGTGIGFSIS